MNKILVLLSFVGVCYSSVQFDTYFKVCNRYATDLNDCMVEAVSKGIIAMADGIKELGLSGIDPFIQEELKVEYNIGPQIETKVNMRNIHVRGLKDSTILNARVKADDDVLRIEINLKIPVINATGDYDAEGKFNAIRMVGSGDFQCTLTDITSNWIIEGVPEEKHGNTYVQIKSFKVTPEMKSVVTHLTNNNKESKAMSDLVVQMVNLYWPTIYKELLPTVQKEWNKIGVDIANEIFSCVPYTTVFPTCH